MGEELIWLNSSEFKNLTSGVLIFWLHFIQWQDVTMVADLVRVFLHCSLTPDISMKSRKKENLSSLKEGEKVLGM